MNWFQLLFEGVALKIETRKILIREITKTFELLKEKTDTRKVTTEIPLLSKIFYYLLETKFLSNFAGKRRLYIFKIVLLPTKM